MGLSFGAGGLFLTLSELHKLGLLYLQKGCWNGRQLLPEEWIMESTKKQVENNLDSYGYGYLFWGRPGGHVPRGRQVLPALDHLQGEKCSHQPRVRVP